MEREGGPRSPDRDLTAESIGWAAIPSVPQRGPHPPRGSCSAAFAAHTRRVGIDDGKASDAGRRRDVVACLSQRSEAAA
jgi:hypothetical protein